VDVVVEFFGDDDFFVSGDVDAAVEFWVMVDVAISVSVDVDAAVEFWVAIFGNVVDVVVVDVVVVVVLREDSGIGVSGDTLVVIVELF